MMMVDNRNLRGEIEELGILSIEGGGFLTEKAVFSALGAIRESKAQRDEEAEWKHIRALQVKKNRKMGEVNYSDAQV
jgi:hypothetical protein